MTPAKCTLLATFILLAYLKTHGLELSWLKVTFPLWGGFMFFGLFKLTSFIAKEF